MSGREQGVTVRDREKGVVVIYRLWDSRVVAGPESDGRVASTLCRRTAWSYLAMLRAGRAQWSLAAHTLSQLQ